MVQYSLILLMCLYLYRAPCHYKFNSDFIEKLTLMEQNVWKGLKSSILQENASYCSAGNPSILQASPTFHVELLPPFISKQPSGITIYHISVTFGLSLRCLDGWIESTSIEAVSAKRRTKASVQVWANGSASERLWVQFCWRNLGSPVLQSNSHLWGVWSLRFFSCEGHVSISPRMQQD